MNRRNKLIKLSSVGWTLNEDAVKTVDVDLPDLGPDEGNVLVTVKNGSAVVSLTVDLINVIPDMDADTNDESVTLTSMSVAASGTASKLIRGFLLGKQSKIKFTKSAATAAAFSAYVEVRLA